MVRRLAGFAGLPLLSLLAPFLLLPLLARVGGVGGWAAILQGQAVGGLGGVVTGLGWSLVGPAMVARALDSPSRRRAVYATSLATRLVALAVAGPVCAVIAALLSAPGHRLTAAAMSIAIVVGALSPSWFSIGVGRPGSIAVYEILPRIGATALAALCLHMTQNLLWYPGLLIVGTVGGVVLYGRRVVGVRGRDVLAVKALREIWTLRSATGTVTVGGSYSQTPLIVAGVVTDVREVATFGSGDKLYRFSLTAVQVLTNALQGWVAETAVEPGQRMTRRMRAAVLVHAGLGVAGLAGFMLMGPWLTGLLFTEELATPPAVSALFGVSLLAVALNSALGRLVLVPRGSTRSVFLSTVVGAVVGLIGMSAFGAWLGALGVAIGFALSEVAVTVFQALAVARRTPRPPRAGSATASADPVLSEDVT